MSSLPPRSTAVRVLAPDARRLDAAALEALGSRRLTGASRRPLLERWRHVVAVAGERVMGVAAYEFEGDELRTHDVCVSPRLADVLAAEVLAEMVAALELACLAAGARRMLVATLVSVGAQALQPCGYEPVGDAWLGKTIG